MKRTKARPPAPVTSYSVEAKDNEGAWYPIEGGRFATAESAKLKVFQLVTRAGVDPERLRVLGPDDQVVA